VTPFAVLICTRERPARLAQTIDALEGQSRQDFPILVVDQSRVEDGELVRRAGSNHRLEMVRDEGKGVGRARNIGWPLCPGEWVVFLDDDCVPEPGWAQALHEAIARHPHVDAVSGHVAGEPRPEHEGLYVTAFPVTQERVRSGRWTWPWEIGFSLCLAVRRSTLERLGGWDERLGVGTAPFPASVDMDFNYRLLKSGGRVLVTPHVRSRHEQWRSREDLAPLFRDYMQGWCGFSMKHLRGGDVLGGLRLWAWGVYDLARMFASGLRRRSLLKLRVAAFKLQGLAIGTARGLTYPW
jgi:GT2 family glycosyltransferase